MADPSVPGSRPPPPPGSTYSAPRGPIPESLQGESYFAKSSVPQPWVETSAPAPVPSQTPLGWIVVAVVGLLCAIGGYLLVSNVFFDADAPSEEEVTAAFVPVSGLSYQAPPDGTREQFRALLDEQGPAADEIAVFDMRLLLIGQQPVGAVAIFSVDPDLLDDEEFENGYISGFNANSPQQITPENVGGVDTFAGHIPGIGSMYTFFEENGLIFVVAGQQRDLMERVVTTLGAANS